VALLAFAACDAVLGNAIRTRAFLSSSIDRDVALEMSKAIVEVDGVLIAFAGVLATLVLGEVRAQAHLLDLSRSIWVLVSVFLSAFFFLLSILLSLAVMFGLHDNKPASSMGFFPPLSFLLYGICLLCVLASGAVMRLPSP
jgi:hypothetical protein